MSDARTPELRTLAAALADRYRLERELGRGGMATVYLAHDLKHDRDVAIKVLHADLAAALGAERFLAEIKTTAKLQHPHILALLDSGSVDGVLYYVMPFVAGESLRARLEREKQLPIEDAVRIAREVADALGHAHAHGIVHRDIKPENILLQGGHAVVADFGIALAVQTAGGLRMTQTGLSLGTPQYMSPEQAMGERAIDLRADIYALGAVTYEMLTGEPPFTGATVQAIVAKVMNERPTPPTTIRDTIPPQVEAAVLKCLAKLPADRWEGASRLADALAGGVAAPGVMGTTPRSWRSALARALLLGIAVLFGGLGTWGLLGMREAATRTSRHVESYPLFTDRRTERRFALSPDGRQFAFVTERADGTPHIVIRNRDALALSPVAGTEGAISVFFSPDGTQLGFLVDDPLLLRIVKLGGPVATVGPMRGGVSGGIDAMWAEDGLIYFSGPGYRNVQRMRPDGSDREDVTTVDSSAGEWWHGHPEPVAGGDGLLFTVRMRDLSYRIAAAKIGTGVHRSLGPGVRAFMAPNGMLVIVDRDGVMRAARFDRGTLSIEGPFVPVESGVLLRSLATVQFTTSRDGTLVYEMRDTTLTGVVELVWVTRAGEVQPLSPPALGEFRAPAISPRDGRVALVDRGDVWVWDLGAGGIARTRLTSTGAEEPSWTPDGRQVSFVASPGGGGQVLMTRSADGATGARVTLSSSELVLDASWSSAGGWVAFREFRSTLEDIFAARPGVDTTRIVVAATPANEMQPRIAPDGRMIAYTSDETGRSEVYLRPFPAVDGWRLQVSLSGGSAPAWDPRSGELLYLDSDGVMWAATIRSTGEGATATRARLFETASWRGRASGAFAVSPIDGRLLMLRPMERAPEARLVFVEGFSSHLERSVRR